MVLHVINCFERDGKVYCDYFSASENYMDDFAPPGTKAGEPIFTAKRMLIDPLATDDKITPEIMLDMATDFSHVIDRFTGLNIKFVCLANDPTCPPLNKEKIVPGSADSMAPCFNSVLIVNPETKDIQKWYAGDTCSVQEPVFIQRSPDCDEGDGYVMCLVNRFEDMRNDLVILDTRTLKKGPIARIKLPLRIKNGLHGKWVNAEDPRLQTAFKNGESNGVTSNGHTRA